MGWKSHRENNGSTKYIALMLYITLLDQFHPGIYSSQVIDVCDYLNSKHKANIRVLAFLSIRELNRSKPKIKALSPTAIILPAFPGLRYFQFTSIFLFWVCLFTGERIAICRNVFCTKMALRIKKYGLLKKVAFDGRSAMKAEIEEYKVFPGDYFKRNIHNFESIAVNQSDIRMAVSQKLVNYWQKNYNYVGNNHVIVPCTLDTKYFNQQNQVLIENNSRLKGELGFLSSDRILVYSGSTAPWQSFTLLEKILTPILDKESGIKVLFLSKENDDIKRLATKYKGRIGVKWVEHKDVLTYLQCCDYGILLREGSNTNLVASPVKFAEYLFAGLKVLISENLGDYSDFVRDYNCGYVLAEESMNLPDLKALTLEEKKFNFTLAQEHFTKEAEGNGIAYKRLVDFLKV